MKRSTSKKRTATSRKRSSTRKTRAATSRKKPATSRKKAPTSRKRPATSRKKAATSKKKGRVAAKTTRRARTPVRRARTSTPARATHPQAAPKARARIPSPLPTRHVAPERGPVALRARSMPPKRERHGLTVSAPARPPVALPEFSEAGVFLAITYSIRDGRRGEFFDLMRELKPLLNAIGGMDICVYEDRSRPNYLMEVFRFKDETEFTAFDDKFHKDRKIAAIYALLDDIVEAEKSDFKIFERRL
ncbi:MAG: hypothetical protein LJF15_15275 [Acidobacteria bacterium]|nr:hypothetical protein [Acidobacteriota bacterium]